MHKKLCAVVFVCAQLILIKDEPINGDGVGILVEFLISRGFDKWTLCFL